MSFSSVNKTPALLSSSSTSLLCLPMEAYSCAISASNYRLAQPEIKHNNKTRMFVIYPMILMSDIHDTYNWRAFPTNSLVSSAVNPRSSSQLICPSAPCKFTCSAIISQAWITRSISLSLTLVKLSSRRNPF